MGESYPALQYLPKGYSYEYGGDGEVAVCNACGVSVRGEVQHAEWHQAVESQFEWCESRGGNDG